MANQSPRNGLLRTLGSLLTVCGLTLAGMLALQAPDASPNGSAVAYAELCHDEQGKPYWAVDCGEGSPNPGPSDPGPGKPQPDLSETRSMPDCNEDPDGNSFGPGGAAFEACLEAHRACLEEDPNDDGVGDDTGEPGGGYSNDEFQANWVRVRPNENAAWGQWNYAGSSCGPTEPPPSPQEIADRFITDLPKGEPTYQPKNKTVVGLKTVFVTHLAENPIQRTYSFGPYEVNVQGEATSYLWHFGDEDGGTLTTDKQGNPYPEQGWTDVTYEYQNAGDFEADVDVTFEGTFNVDGGAAQALPPITIVDGPAVPVQVVEGDPVLVY